MEQRAWRLFASRFLRDAAAPESERQIDSQLTAKVAQLPPDTPRHGKLRAVVQQASQLWARRTQLRKRDVLYLAAALLYFISPLDAVPDLLPGLGYVDDAIVVSAVVAMILRGATALGTQGRERLEQWIDERTEIVLQKLDETATSGVQRTVAAVALGLWGTTTAAGISLAMATVLGSYPVEFLVYVALSSALIVAWNVVTAVSVWRQYRRLDGTWQQRLRMLVAGKLTAWHLLAVGLPVVVLIGLGIWRAVS
ncbi:MAG: DUF1232 domain-containing protein [Pirellulaceae bacterium]|jgi:uncharacterized membrane protein YkvA (DUF1232 family)|nr:DUF1232 domain-containing protein [Pirellulaceae bacterium]